jgi:uncharacterized membrane protein
MNLVITFIIIGLWFFDLLFTYFNITILRKLYPDKSYSEMEMNKMNVFFWNKLGLKKGTITSALFQIPLLLLIFYLLSFNEKMLYTLFGIYVVVFYIHLENYFYCKGKIKEEMEK